MHYVIYSVDLTSDGHMKHHTPPEQGDWTETEGDEQYEYDYLGEGYENGQHRKWCGILNDLELMNFLDKCFGLTLEEARNTAEPTMGSLTELGLMPAYSINSSPMDWNLGGVTDVVNIQAYITEDFDSPTPPTNEKVKELYGIDTHD